MGPGFADLSEAPVPVVEVSRDNFMLGGCANVLNNIFAMGGGVIWPV